MRIGNTKYKIKNPIRLIVAAVILAAAVFFGLQSCSSEDPNAVYESPAATPCFANCDSAEPVPFTFPLPDEAQLNAFRDQAYAARDDSFFYEGYVDGLGVPVQFDVYIPQTSVAGHPDYFVADGAVFVPTVVIPFENPGAFDAIVREDGKDTRTVTLGFASDQVPNAGFVRVWGYLHWSTGYLHPNFNDASVDQPLVVVGAWQEMSASQLRAPAARTHPPDAEADPMLVVRANDIRLAVNRVEFAPDETRVHVNVRNLSSANVQAWNTDGAVLIDADGREYGLAKNTGMPDELDASSLPAGGQVDARLSKRGYLLFPAVNPNGPLILSLPHPNNLGDTLRLEIPPSSAADRT